MNIQHYRERNTEWYEIYPFQKKQYPFCITVKSVYNRQTFVWEAPKIHWPAMHNLSNDDAEDFASAINVAIAFSKALEVSAEDKNRSIQKKLNTIGKPND